MADFRQKMSEQPWGLWWLQAQRRDHPGIGENPEGLTLLIADFSLAVTSQKGGNHAIRAGEIAHLAPVAFDQHVSSCGCPVWSGVSEHTLGVGTDTLPGTRTGTRPGAPDPGVSVPRPTVTL